MPLIAEFLNMPRWFYTLLLHLLLPLVWLRLLWRGRQDPGYAENRAERLGRHAPLPQHGIVLHAVSLGETLAAQPLVNALLASYPQWPLLITNTTATGAARARALWAGRAQQCFLPYDYPWAVRRFLDNCQPRLVIIMETELWPNLLQALAERQIPVLLANARLSARSARGYGRVAGLVRPMLQQLRVLAAQDQDTAQRFLQLGLPPQCLQVTGSLKFDLTLPTDLPARVQAVRAQWALAERPVWVAASTHEGEDAVLLEVHRRLRQRFPQALLLLVPRHPERFERVADLLARQGWSYVRRSRAEAVQADTAVFLGDSLGELLLWYALAQVAFVGGSLVQVGGHNPLEPAALAVPVVTGPVMFNFQQIADTLQQAGALRQGAEATELATRVGDWLADPAAAQQAGAAGLAVVEANRGALARHMALIAELLAS